MEECPRSMNQQFIHAFISCKLTTIIFPGSGLCSKDEFKCDVIKCINKTLQCDGKVNCNDHSDELHCGKQL